MSFWDYVDKYTFDSPTRQISLLLAEVRRLNHFRSNQVLDVGGGLVDRGKVIDALGKRVVVDIVPGPNVDLVGDIHKLKLPANRFTLVTLFMVLEHLYEPLVALENCRKTLKPQGLLVLTTPQYWHTHRFPHDYYRYTKEGLLYLCQQSGFKVEKIWSLGGPFLVLYHVLELNLPGPLRKIFILTCPLFNYFDYLFFRHEDKRENADAVGWALVARKI